MFEDWKKAWDQAVANFERELHGDDSLPAGPRAAGMRRDLAAAHKALDRLELDLGQSRRDLAAEDEQIATCERRAVMADNIGDVETARIAREYGQRHLERAGILRRKVEVLQDELAMRQHELTAMEEQAAVELQELQKLEQSRIQHDADFRKLEQDRREREAEARLEELKKKMSG